MKQIGELKAKNESLQAEAETVRAIMAKQEYLRQRYPSRKNTIASTGSRAMENIALLEEGTVSAGTAGLHAVVATMYKEAYTNMNKDNPTEDEVQRATTLARTAEKTCKLTCQSASTSVWWIFRI